MEIRKFGVFLVNLDPTIGKEIKKTRPCLVISPNEMNAYISTVIIAPMTTASKNYPSRIDCHFQGKDGQIVLDQLRTVDKVRLTKYLGPISSKTQDEVTKILLELFSE